VPPTIGVRFIPSSGIAEVAEDERGEPLKRVTETILFLPALSGVREAGNTQDVGRRRSETPGDSADVSLTTCRQGLVRSTQFRRDEALPLRRSSPAVWRWRGSGRARRCREGFCRIEPGRPFDGLGCRDFHWQSSPRNINDLSARAGEVYGELRVFVNRSSAVRYRTFATSFAAP
jgi:hypothetical protein